MTKKLPPGRAEDRRQYGFTGDNERRARFVLGGATTKGTAANAAMNSAAQGNSRPGAGFSSPSGAGGNPSGSRPSGGGVGAGFGSPSGAGGNPSGSKSPSGGGGGGFGGGAGNFGGGAPARGGAPASGGFGGGAGNFGGGGKMGAGSSQSGGVRPSTGSGQIGSKGGGASTQQPGSGKGAFAATPPGKSVSAAALTAAADGLAQKRAAVTQSLLGPTTPNERKSLQQTYGQYQQPPSPPPTAEQVAARLQRAYPDRWGQYPISDITRTVDQFAQAMPGEADINKYGAGALRNVGQVGINQVLRNITPENMLSNMDTTGIRPGTDKFSVPGKNSMGMTANWSDQNYANQAYGMALRALDNAIDNKGISPDARNATNFVAAGTPLPQGVGPIGKPINGTQFGNDAVVGNVVSDRNQAALKNLASTAPSLTKSQMPAFFGGTDRLAPSSTEVMQGVDRRMSAVTPTKQIYDRITQENVPPSNQQSLYTGRPAKTQDRMNVLPSNEQSLYTGAGAFDPRSAQKDQSRVPMGTTLPGPMPPSMPQQPIGLGQYLTSALDGLGIGAADAADVDGRKVFTDRLPGGSTPPGIGGTPGTYDGPFLPGQGTYSNIIDKGDLQRARPDYARISDDPTMPGRAVVPSWEQSQYRGPVPPGAGLSGPLPPRGNVIPSNEQGSYFGPVSNRTVVDGDGVITQAPIGPRMSGPPMPWESARPQTAMPIRDGSVVGDGVIGPSRMNGPPMPWEGDTSMAAPERILKVEDVPDAVNSFNKYEALDAYKSPWGPEGIYAFSDASKKKMTDSFSKRYPDWDAGYLGEADIPDVPPATDQEMQDIRPGEEDTGRRKSSVSPSQQEKLINDRGWQKKVWDGATRLLGPLGIPLRMLTNWDINRINDMSPDEQAAIQARWAAENKAYLAGNIGQSNHGSSNAYLPGGGGWYPSAIGAAIGGDGGGGGGSGDGTTGTPPASGGPGYGQRRRLNMPPNPYTYGYGPAHNYFTYE